MTQKVKVFNIQHFSLNDGPGIRTVVFFKGCPLNCIWCHNPEGKSLSYELSLSDDLCTDCRKCADLCHVHSFSKTIHHVDRTKCTFCGKCIDICPSSALEILGKNYTIEEIMAELSKDDVFFSDGGGVTLSGGEPFMQFEPLYTLLKACKEKGYHTCIETSGYTSESNIIKAAQYTDLFLYDCKETDPQRHKEYTGVDNKVILNNLSVLNQLKASVILRCPVIPGINDRKSHFESIAKLANQYRCIKSVEFMPYHPLGVSKSANLGSEILYENNDFLDRHIVEDFASCVKKSSSVPIKIN